MAIVQIGGVAFGLLRRTFLNLLAMLAGKKMIYFLIGKAVDSTETLVDDHMFAAFQAAEKNDIEGTMEHLDRAYSALRMKKEMRDSGQD